MKEQKNQCMNLDFFFFFSFSSNVCAGCTPGDKAAFNGHLIRLFTTEFNRLPTTPIPSKPGCKSAIQWMVLSRRRFQL